MEEKSSTSRECTCRRNFHTRDEYAIVVCAPHCNVFNISDSIIFANNCTLQVIGCLIIGSNNRVNGWGNIAWGIHNSISGDNNQYLDQDEEDAIPSNTRNRISTKCSMEEAIRKKRYLLRKIYQHRYRLNVGCVEHGYIQYTSLRDIKYQHLQASYYFETQEAIDRIIADVNTEEKKAQAERKASEDKRAAAEREYKRMQAKNARLKSREKRQAKEKEAKAYQAMNLDERERIDIGYNIAVVAYPYSCKQSSCKNIRCPKPRYPGASRPEFYTLCKQHLDESRSKRAA